MELLQPLGAGVVVVHRLLVAGVLGSAGACVPLRRGRRRQGLNGPELWGACALLAGPAQGPQKAEDGVRSCCFFDAGLRSGVVVSIVRLRRG